VLPLVRGGKLAPVAVTTSKRSPMLPDTPTLDEAGIKGIDAGIWLGLFAPAGTPPTIIARLNAEVTKALGAAEVRESLTGEGGEVLGGTPAQFAEFLRAEQAKWSKVVRESGVKLD